MCLVGCTEPNTELLSRKVFLQSHATTTRAPLLLRPTSSYTFTARCKQAVLERPKVTLLTQADANAHTLFPRVGPDRLRRARASGLPLFLFGCADENLLIPGLVCNCSLHMMFSLWVQHKLAQHDARFCKNFSRQAELSVCMLPWPESHA